MLICTGDRDALQLVDAPASRCSTRKRGVSDLTRFTPEEVQAKYGLTPAQYPDFAALRGDPSDNLPGIPGVGEKTAAKWVREYGSLDELVDQVDEVPGKVGDALRANLGQRRAQPAADRTGARRRPLELGVDDLRPCPVGPRRGARAVRRPAVPGAARAAVRDARGRRAGGRPGLRRRGQAPRCRRGRAVARRARARRQRGSAWRSAGTGAAAPGRWPASRSRPRDGAAAYLRARRGSTPHDERGARRLAGRSGHAQGGARRQGPAARPAPARLDACGRHERHPAGRPTCSARTSARSTWPTWRCATCTASCAANVEDSGQLTLDGGVDESDDALADAETVRASAVRDLADAFDADLERAAARPGCSPTSSCRWSTCWPTWRRSASPPTPTSCSACRPSSAPRSRRWSRRRTPSSAASSTSARPSSCRRSCSTSSSCRRRSGSRPATPPTPTRSPTCTSRPSTRCSDMLLRHREVARLKTVVDGLLPLVDDAGRIHTTFNQTVAATGRLSSTDPNLQNIPVRTAEGRRIREAFIVGAGFESLMTADYSQIEMRIMAHLSRDAGLIEAFTSGEDLHTFVASRAFDLPADEIDAELRRRVKAMSYGLAYGLSRVRAGPAAQDHRRRGARADGRLLRPLRRGARLPATRWSTRRGRPATPRRSWAGAATCPTSTATTATRARWPSGWRSTRRSRAAPPTSSRSRCSACTAAWRQPGCGRGCCCRCTTNSCSRSRPASATQVEELVREQMARRVPAGRRRSTCRSASGRHLARRAAH